MSLDLDPPPRRSRTDLYRDGVLPIGYHEGSSTDFLLRHGQECSGYDRMAHLQQEQLLGELLTRIADTRNLIQAAEHTISKGRKAAGPNRQRLADLWASNRTRVYEEIRSMARSVRESRYAPGPVRNVLIPKASGKGTRPIEVMNWQDMVVQRAIVQICQPLIDPRLGDLCFGARPNRDRLQAMAHAKAISDRDGRHVLIAADLKDAFTTVPHAPLIELVKRHVGKPVADLIERVVGNNNRERGVAQGAPLSSLLLDVYLNTQLDQRWNRDYPDLPMIRWVDDLLILCRSTEEAREAYTRLQEILRPTGMRLKGDAGTDIFDLDEGKQPEWLGNAVEVRDGSLGYQPSKRLLVKLGNRLAEQIEREDGALRCSEILLAVFNQLGPCYTTPDRDRVVEQAREAAFAVGADEPPTNEILLDEWKRSYARYELTLASVQHLYGKDEGRSGNPGQGSAAGQSKSPEVGRLSEAEQAPGSEKRGASARRRPSCLAPEQPDGVGCWGAAFTPGSSADATDSASDSRVRSEFAPNGSARVTSARMSAALPRAANRPATSRRSPGRFRGKSGDRRRRRTASTGGHQPPNLDGRVRSRRPKLRQALSVDHHICRQDRPRRQTEASVPGGLPNRNASGRRVPIPRRMARGSHRFHRMNETNVIIHAGSSRPTRIIRLSGGGTIRRASRDPPQFRRSGSQRISRSSTAPHDVPKPRRRRREPLAGQIRSLSGMTARPPPSVGATR